MIDNFKKSQETQKNTNKTRKYTGSINMGLIWNSLEYFDLSHNEFDELISFNVLSNYTNLIYLSLANNYISSNLSLNNLPRYLEYFNIGNNNFEGIIDLLYLPTTIVTFNILNNSLLSGYLDFSSLLMSDDSNDMIYDIGIDASVHCDPQLYCQDVLRIASINCIETYDRNSNWCYDYYSCVDTCSNCSIIESAKTNESCIGSTEKESNENWIDLILNLDMNS